MFDLLTHPGNLLASEVGSIGPFTFHPEARVALQSSSKVYSGIVLASLATRNSRKPCSKPPLN